MKHVKEVSPSASEVSNTYQVLPEHTNAIGTIFGGTLMAWMDIAAAICAFRHARCQCVTVSVDQLDFKSPVKQGHLVNIRARMTFVHVTSMEIRVEAQSEDPFTGERINTCSAYFTFVTQSGKKEKVPAPGLLLKTSEEKEEFEQGRLRREQRLKARHEGLSARKSHRKR